MSLSRSPAFLSFLSHALADSDVDQDAARAGEFAGIAGGEKVARVLEEAKGILAGALPLDELGSEGNRWFGDEDEARAWLAGIVAALEAATGASDSPTVKDSNGAPLAEGDSVLVIKDLKVKGGSSDLKRGTLIRKIHLVGDPDVVECRVDGSTLVLKTCFLKKA